MSSTPVHASSDARGAEPYRYDRAQRLFHWSMALIIIVALAIGVACSVMTPGTSPRRELLDIHKSLGMTAGLLILFRIGYRLFRGEPAYRRSLGRLTRLGARAGHLGLYVLMVALPVTGYLYSGAGGYSLPWFGVFSWPRLVPLDKGLSRLGFELHGWAGWTMIAVLGVHVAAVLWHGVVLRDEVPSRMASGPGPPETERSPV